MPKRKVFNVHKYNQAQIVDSLTCPLNRHATRVEHQCDDFELHKHPDWLLDHYIKCGGAVYWETKREQYFDEVEVDK